MAFSSDNFFLWTDKHGNDQHKILKKDYISYIGEAIEFDKLVFSLALRNGYGNYQKTIIISDGAKWIRDMKNVYFPDAQQILDYWHLCKTVNDYAKKIFGIDESKFKPWSDEICTLLKNSQTEDALSKIKKINKRQSSKTKQNLAHYIENNINNVDYATYKRLGYFVGSGAIESSNKTVIQNRIKQPGMRWNVETVQNIATLTSKLKSKRWDKDVVNAVYEKYNLNPGKQFLLQAGSS